MNEIISTNTINLSFKTNKFNEKALEKIKPIVLACLLGQSIGYKKIPSYKFILGIQLEIVDLVLKL